jgi:hypothetical protein
MYFIFQASLLSVTVARALQLEGGEADRLGARTGRTGDSRLEAQEMARAKEIAMRQGQIIVFICERGLIGRFGWAATCVPTSEALGGLLPMLLGEAVELPGN